MIHRVCPRIGSDTRATSGICALACTMSSIILTLPGVLCWLRRGIVHSGSCVSCGPSACVRHAASNPPLQDMSCTVHPSAPLRESAPQTYPVPLLSHPILVVHFSPPFLWAPLLAYCPHLSCVENVGCRALRTLPHAHIMRTVLIMCSVCTEYLMAYGCHLVYQTLSP